MESRSFVFVFTLISVNLAVENSEVLSDFRLDFSSMPRACLSVFHSLQSGHLPMNVADPYPQFEQMKNDMSALSGMSA